MLYIVTVIGANMRKSVLLVFSKEAVNVYWKTRKVFSYSYLDNNFSSNYW